MPQQQGGGGGRGLAPQQPQYGGRGGGFYQGRGAGPQPRGGMAPQQAGASRPEFQGRGGAPQPRGGMMPQFAHQEYQGRGGTPQPRGGGVAPQQLGSQHEYRGRGGPQPRGGMLPQQYGGGRGGGGQVAGRHGAGPSGGPTRPPAPELHQATATYQASQPSPTVEPSSSQLQPPEITFGQVEQQFQQLSVQGGEKPSQAIQTVASALSSKSMRFPSRPGMGSFGDRCIVKANHFFAELPDKDLHQYDVGSSLLSFYGLL